MLDRSRRRSGCRRRAGTCCGRAACWRRPTGSSARTWKSTRLLPLQRAREEGSLKRSPISVSRELVESALHVHGGRFAGDGVHAVDLETIVAKIRTWEDWYPAWAAVGER